VLDDEQCYQAAASKDARFDGVFFTAVTSTGIYCRPSCPAITPRRENMRFYRTAAAAQDSGFRACKRCRPDASPGSPEWNIRADVVGRAMRLIADGVIDRDGVAGLATRLGYEQRQVRRLITAELGAGPLAIARAQRAQTARTLIETTDLPLSDIAFAAGFTSIRQFNATIQEVFASPPSDLRARRRGPAAGPGAITLRLAYRTPIDLTRIFGFLAARAIPGVEAGSETSYRRTLLLPHGTGVMAVAEGGPGWLSCTLRLSDLRDLAAAVQRCRRLFDLDADTAPIAAALGEDLVLGPLVAKCPGRRVPGHVDGDELAIRAVLGQQVSVAAARRLGARLVTAYGVPIPAPAPGTDGPDGELTHCFPTAAALAEADPAGLPMPKARATALTGLATALARGDVVLDGGADRERTAAALLALPGIGPWTVGYIRMRALSDPDSFLPTDAGVLAALRGLGASGDPLTLAEAWRPWRSYAVQHLWAYLEGK
jgi:AraC family transcriptional regulator, regulatory protein of adaptative response / DNA-3-methyladenine glycosylase II